MIELLFMACLSTAPERCQERSLVFTDLTPARCMLGAQPELAKWTMSHPAFRVTRWQCRAVVRDQHDA